METIDLTLLIATALILFLFLVWHEHLFGKMIKQNTAFLQSADHRLDKANEMVLTLAHSADELAKSIAELKEMMVHLEKVYSARNDTLTKNRDEFRDAYLKLLARYEALEGRHDEVTTKCFSTLTELARRPTMGVTNNNTNSANEKTE